MAEDWAEVERLRAAQRARRGMKSKRCATPDCGRAVGPPVVGAKVDPNGRCWWCAHGIPPQPKPGAKELKR